MPFFVRRRRPSVRATAGALLLTMVAALSPATEQAAVAATGYQPLKPQVEKLVPTKNAVPRKAADPDQTGTVRTPASTAWPSPGSATVTVGPQANKADRKAAATVGSLPVAVSGAGTSKVKVDVVNTAGTPWAGKPQVLLRLTRADGGKDAGNVDVSVNYAAFRNAGGADFGNRLRLVKLPDCALATPEAASCAGTPVPSTNNGDGWVGATVSAAPEESKGLYALAAAAGGRSGSFAATSLSPSGSWEAGGSSGDFTWSYPLRVPPSLGGPMPSLGLAYSAQSVDGRTATTNNQPSWIGEGFEMWSGYVERSYRPCSDDVDTPEANNKDHKTGDLCWATDNATMSLNGKTVELIRDDSGKGSVWHPRQDDGSKIERLTGSGPDNGDNDGEHWKITTANGTKYWFGLNHIPGWQAKARETNSTWTVPVFGNNPKEPCNLPTFGASHCNQAWRWNLDYVEDPHGNSMSYWYTKETSRYGMNLTPTDAREYVRGGTLDEIHYGTRPSITSGTGSNLAAPPMQVKFGSADRCLPDKSCDIVKKENWPNWPDVPWDQYCGSSTSCDQTGPTFFTKKRLETITTQVLSGTGLKDVERWTLKHTYKDPGDGTRAGLWLEAISHAGLDVPAGQPPTTVPDVTFAGKQLPNRVDSDTDQKPAMNWWRISNINTETGAHIGIAYSDPECRPGRTPSAPDTNTMRCYPVKWTPDGFTEPITDWFNKYVVTGVTEVDDVGGSRPKETHYTYIDGAAWHYVDDNGIITSKDKTWSVWRGYGRVRVTEGVGDEATTGETLYFRGMDGDKKSSGTKSVQLPDSQGGSTPDKDEFAGMPREQISLNGTAEVSGVITDMWASAPTATRTINGDAVVARYIAPGSVHKRTVLDGGRGLLKNTVKTTYDSFGMAIEVEDAGDESKAGDEKCTTTTYARNTDSWLLSYISRAQSVALSCGQTPTKPEQVLADGRTSFDRQAFGVAPSRGDVTQIESLRSWANATPSYLVNTKSLYDGYGRVTESWDIRGNRSQTVYTPESGGPLTRTVSTNSLNWVTTVDHNPATGVMLAQVDPNGRRTDLSYDGLGRLVSVWLPGRDKQRDEPSTKYAYTVRTSGVNTVTSSSINSNAGYITTYTLYDGLLRPRQSQAAAAGSAGGRLITDTFYDSAGRVSVENGIYSATGEAGPELATYTDQNLIPTQTRTTYDAAGRPTVGTVSSLGERLWQTTTAYGGDHTDVTPPQGATPVSTYTDIYDRTTEIRQYHGSTPTGAYDATKYTYNDRNQPVTVTAPDNTVRTFGYDFLGRQTSLKDPDRGTSTTEYNDYGDVLSTTDARGHKLAYTYDVLGRRTASFDGSTSGTKLAAWTYDSVAKGQPADTTRYSGGNAYKTAVTAYDPEYRPRGTTITIPTTDPSLGALARTYTFNTSYTADGKLAKTTSPAAGGLPAEEVTYQYSDLGLPTTLTSDVGSYITETQYTDRGEPAVYTLKTGDTQPRAEVRFQYDTGTRRLNETQFTRESSTPDATISHTRYKRDPVGNVLQIVQTPKYNGDPVAPNADTQCFTYDYLQRLTEAWTPGNGNCTGTPSLSSVGGAAPYWQSYGYDLSGNRLSKTDHNVTPAPTAGPAGDTTTTYQYPNNGTQPHTITSAKISTAGGTTTKGYTYDANGSMLTRADGQQLSWDAEGQLATATDSGKTSSYVYNTDGTPLVSREPTGTTLYLPGMELRLDATTKAITGTRYYTDAMGATLAQRTQSGVTWLMPDPQGTTNTTVATDPKQTVSQRWQQPFGESRGAKPSAWANRRGFVGGATRETGLEQVGARSYDASLGAFISADAVLDVTDPMQLQGYTYSASSPITKSDPSGNMFKGDDGGACVYCNGPGGSKGHGGGGGGGGKKSAPPSTNKSNSHHSDDDNGWGWLGKAWNATANFVDEHKAVIAGVAVGIIIDVGCTVATGGAGAYACGIAASAAASAVEYSINAAADGSFSLAGLGGAALQGAAMGVVTGGLGMIAGLGAKALVAAGKGIVAATRAGAAAARGAATSAERTAISTGARAAGKAAAESAGAGTGRSASRAVTKGGCNSFVAATLVLLASGALVPISQVHVGDKVQATDPTTGTTSVQTVTATHETLTDREFTDLTIKDSEGHIQTITSTQGHPYWDATRKAFVQAASLFSGDALREPGGATSTVLNVRNYISNATTHNLTVADSHTYYVVEGGTPILVHNCNLVANNRPEKLADELRTAKMFGVSPIEAGSEAFHAAAASGGTYIWALAEGGALRMMPANGIINHTVLTGGGRVIGAGEVTFARSSGAYNKVAKITDATGHYTPTCRCGAGLQAGADAFTFAGIVVPKRAIQPLGW